MSADLPQSPRHVALIPAAGTGTRVGATLPKQYLLLGPRTMLEWSVDALCAMPWIERIVVVVAPDDQRAAALLAARPRVEVLAHGGTTRRDTVLAGLHALTGRHEAGDWVLVHDAARPAVDEAALERLRDAVASSSIGGLLALPVGDTVKRIAGDSHSVAATLDRTSLWAAQTPQMFRLGLLLGALAAHADVTDEASAIERAGYAPLLVEGTRANFKVTSAEDVALMRLVLAARSGGQQ
ncbi:MAG: 2-C-methyl-D-erythritol 4-phosphate cytidylyltransferase [Burkholderiaceae bacterium]|nr:2-C-methyl-D-erythritol 4-phosphate cytidylyltransferase [Burkholderiaceae bacterium]